MSKERDLIARGVPGPGGVWADLGSGTGIFTLELRGLLGPTCTIYSVDRNGRDLDRQRRDFAERYPGSDVRFIEADFTRPLNLPELDGLLMANSLHYVPYPDQVAVLARLCAHLRRPEGRFVLVEYNARSGNPWVPYPVDMELFGRLARAVGLSNPDVLAAIPSRFLREMYAALARWR
jgi:ubiquinone/menaquinone biosynthesis C-methylase UbiE